MFESLLEYVTGSNWTYLFLFAIAVIDAVFPAVPSETALITAGVLAGTGRLSLPVIVLSGAAGAWVGDNTSYLIGRSAGQRVVRRFFTGEKANRRLSWARRQLDERGVYLVVVARFIPGGRTVTTFTAGLVHYPWVTRFAPATVLAGSVWALYASVLGYVGGRAFTERPLLALGIAIAIAFGITILIEVVRKVRHARAA